MASHELAATYASLILADEGVEITTDKIVQLTSAAGVPVEPIWASLLAKALEGKDMKELLFNIGSGAGAAPVAAAPAAGGEAPAEEEKKEEKKEEPKEESDEDVSTPPPPCARQMLTRTDGLRSLRLNSYYTCHWLHITPWWALTRAASVFTIQLRLRRGNKKSAIPSQQVECRRWAHWHAASRPVDARLPAPPRCTSPSPLADVACGAPLSV